MGTIAATPTTIAATPTTIDGLFASTPAPLPFAPTLAIRAFVLLRSEGNLLIYAAPGLGTDAPRIAELGAASRWYLNHSHEAMFAPSSAPAPLFIHEKERAAVTERLPIRATFSRRHLLDQDFEVIPTPGHTAGATTFLWDSGEHRLLFTGDTIYLDHGEWRAAVLGSSDRARYIDSLELIRTLDFDVLVPWTSGRGGDYLALTTRADARRRIGAILARIGRDDMG
jgi:glyoxylase-like metal-dependent hydrolase (beta-lactamase superfamily II)